MMKKILIFNNQGSIVSLLFLLVFILTGSTLNAQNEDAESETTASPIQIGAKFGTTLSQFTDQQPYTNNAQGLTAGAFVRYGFSDLFALQLEASYSQQGGRLTNYDVPDYYGLTDTWYDMKAENRYLRMHNIEVPLLAQFSFKMNDTRLKLNLGPAFSYNLHSGILAEGTVFSDNEFHTYTGEENISSVINSYEYSAIGGIGFEFDVSDNLFLTVDARYKYGINPVYEGYSYIRIPQIQGDLQNHSMYFTLGFGF